METITKLPAISSVGEEDEKVDEDEHMKSVHNMVEYHIHLMTMYVEGISDEVFIDEMGIACDLDKPVYGEIADHVKELLKELTPYTVLGTEWEVVNLIDVSTMLMDELFTHEQGKHMDMALQEQFSRYSDIAIEAGREVIRRMNTIS